MPTPDQMQAIFVSVCAYAGVFFVVANPLVHGLLAAAEALHVYAATTPSKADDEFADRAVATLHKVADALDWLARVVPHATVKGAK